MKDITWAIFSGALASLATVGSKYLSINKASAIVPGLYPIAFYAVINIFMWLAFLYAMKHSETTVQSIFGLLIFGDPITIQYIIGLIFISYGVYLLHVDTVDEISNPPELPSDARKSD